MNRRAFIGLVGSGIVGLAAWQSAPATAAPAVPAAAIPGVEFFRDFDFSKAYPASSRKRVLDELKRRGTERSVIGALIKEDFKNGNVCEVRGVVLSQTECVLFDEVRKAHS